MAVWTDQPWHIGPSTVASTTLDLDIDVPDVPSWSTAAPARKDLDLCGGPPTLIYRTDGGDGWASMTITFLVPADDDEATVLTALDAFWTLKGPWAITDALGTTRSVVVDPTLGQRTFANQGLYRLVGIPVQQVA